MLHSTILEANPATGPLRINLSYLLPICLVATLGGAQDVQSRLPVLQLRGILRGFSIGRLARSAGDKMPVAGGNRAQLVAPRLNCCYSKPGQHQVLAVLPQYP
jgi:hypothetical protein